MDPHKKAFLEAFLEDRLTRENLSEYDKANRMKRLNFMIRSKINNLRKHIFNKDKDKESG